MTTAWKKEEEKRKANKQKRVFWGFVIGVISFLVLATVFKLALEVKNSKIKDLGRINFLLFSSEKISLFSYSQEGVTELVLPPDLAFKLTRGFGEYKVKTVYSLGELEGKGKELLTESVQEFLGLPVNGVLVSSPSPVKKALFSAFMKRSAITNFSRFDLFYLWLVLGRKPEASWEKLGPIDNGEKKTEKLIEGHFKDRKIIEEGLAVAVFNTTGEIGMGTKAARFATNIGSRVIKVGNSESLVKTKCRSSQKVGASYTLRILRLIFDCDWEEAEVEDGRADIGLYLGKDYWKKLTEKW